MELGNGSLVAQLWFEVVADFPFGSWILGPISAGLFRCYASEPQPALLPIFSGDDPDDFSQIPELIDITMVNHSSPSGPIFGSSQSPLQWTLSISESEGTSSLDPSCPSPLAFTNQSMLG